MTDMKYKVSQCAVTLSENLSEKKGVIHQYELRTLF